MNLYMVRHGQTAASRENRFSGRSDPPLTAVGEAMAHAFATAYAALTWDAIYCSPMLRARQTADSLGRLTNVQVVIEDGLKEIAYGEWEGLRQDEVREQWPKAFAYWADDVASRGTPGGETAFQVAARAMRVVGPSLMSQSDAGGGFTFGDVPAGAYTLRADAGGVGAFGFTDTFGIDIDGTPRGDPSRPKPAREPGTIEVTVDADVSDLRIVVAGSP